MKSWGPEILKPSRVITQEGRHLREVPQIGNGLEHMLPMCSSGKKFFGEAL